MTKRELKRLTKNDLMELLLEQRLRGDDLQKQLETCRERLESREIKVSESGSIAEAALKINGIFEAAQAAADQYLENVRKLSGNQASSYPKIELQDAPETLPEDKPRPEQWKKETIEDSNGKNETWTFRKPPSVESELEAEKLLARTKLLCSEIRARAKEECDQLREKTKEDRKLLLSMTHDKCVNLRVRAKKEYDEYITQARSEYDQILVQAKEERARLLKQLQEQAQSDRDELLSKAREECRQLREQAQSDSDELLSKAREECRQLRKQAQSDRDELLSKAREECRQLRKQAQSGGDARLQQAGGQYKPPMPEPAQEQTGSFRGDPVLKDEIRNEIRNETQNTSVSAEMQAAEKSDPLQPFTKESYSDGSRQAQDGSAYQADREKNEKGQNDVRSASGSGRSGPETQADSEGHRDHIKSGQRKRGQKRGKT